jgi:hypothetical protein
MYQEHYFENLDDKQREINRLHSGGFYGTCNLLSSTNKWKEHCLTHLREVAMCHGDVGMVPYSWANFSRKPQAKATGHQCVEWSSIVEWTNQRTVNMFEPGLLIHPTLGKL